MRCLRFLPWGTKIGDLISLRLTAGQQSAQFSIIACISNTVVKVVFVQAIKLWHVVWEIAVRLWDFLSFSRLSHLNHRSPSSVHSMEEQEWYFHSTGIDHSSYFQDFNTRDSSAVPQTETKFNYLDINHSIRNTKYQNQYAISFWGSWHYWHLILYGHCLGD